MSSLLAEISALSMEFGTAAHVLGGGGNTSAKDEATLWVKPSGTALKDMTPSGFVPLRRQAIDAIFEEALPAEADGRERAVKERMQAAVESGSVGRPSVEAPLHNLLPWRYVVHTHPGLVNGMTCAVGGAQACRALFPDAMWVPYVDPGFTLCVAVREALRVRREAGGAAPSCVMLQNHGLFVGGDTVPAVREGMAKVLDTLRGAYRSSGRDAQVQETRQPAARDVGRVHKAARELLKDDAAAMVTSGEFPLFAGPLTPDHIVSAGAHACLGTRREDLSRFREEYGRYPRVLGGHHAVFGLGTTAAAAQLALDLARDAASIERLSAAFGGPRYLGERECAFIENWEVEHYRRQVMGGGGQGRGA